MKKQILRAVAIPLLLLSATTSVQAADDSSSVINGTLINQQTKKSRSSSQRIAANKITRNLTFSSIGNAYTDFKNKLSHLYGVEYSIDVSYMGQRGAPNGKHNSMQTLISPSVTWTAFNNEYGTGTVNAAYNITRYGGKSGTTLQKNIGVTTGINDYGSAANSFDELAFTYQPGGDWNWLSFTAGQFPLYNFDGSTYSSNQQVNFINYALSQNASETYSTAGVGLYTQITPTDEWSFAFGAQDASDISATSVQINHLSDKHYTTFAAMTYSPTIKGLGSGQYSILLYNQPGVKLQPETTNGWSLNLSQNIGEKFSIFAKINGVSGNTATINQSWVLGGVYNNPLDRNPLDQIGLAFAYNKIDEKAVGSDIYHNSEKIIEAYWAWGISKWMTITPDIQFYIDPAENPKSDYATVFTLRSTFFF